MRACAVLRTLAAAVVGLSIGTAAADYLVSDPGPNNLDLAPDGEFVIVGLDGSFSPVSGVIATNVVGKEFFALFAWSNSVVTLANATFTGPSGYGVQARDTSTVNYTGGFNPDLELTAFDAATINMSGGTAGFLATDFDGGFATLTGGTITQLVSCFGGSIVVSGGALSAPTYGLPYSFLSFVPAGVTFQGTGVVAEWVGVDDNGFDGNIWLLHGTLANGGSLEGVYMVDVGVFDPTVIVNYAGVTIMGGGPVDNPPVADAGVDFSVDEGAFVTLDGTASSDPDGDALSFSWTQVGGPPVALSGANTATPSFVAPSVPFGGLTASFMLSVTANNVTVTDVVNVTIVNINHAPVAIAGPNQTVAEGGLVTLQGQHSFDIDGDPFTFAWTQVGGTPVVALSGANTANPTFVAPFVSNAGAALVFELRVDDGFPPDAPASGYSLSDVTSRVTIYITNVNGIPVANAGPDKCVNENTATSLNGSASSDPDGDALSFSWTQIGGPAVTLSGANTATPTFTTPSVNSCGVSLTFRLTVNDGFGGTAFDDVVIHVKNVGSPPNISCARPSDCELWPPNHQLECIKIEGVTSQGSGVTITITGVTQDEPTNGLGDGDTPIDAFIKPNGTVLLRSERKGNGDGRVYRVSFTATNAAGSASGVVKVKVPKSKNSGAVEGSAVYISTQ
jgi:hypothetical protein